jgi:putative FmdB family regulatory protein
MPTYEYKCATCGGVFELKQRFSDPPLTTHEGCGGAVERIIFAPALQFKGSGWYITDYARGGASNKDAQGKDSQGKDSSAKDAGTKDSSNKDSSSNGSSSTTSKSEAPASSSSSTDSKK